MHRLLVSVIATLGLLWTATATQGPDFGSAHHVGLVPEGLEWTPSNGFLYGGQGGLYSQATFDSPLVLFNDAPSAGLQAVRSSSKLYAVTIRPPVFSPDTRKNCSVRTYNLNSHNLLAEFPVTVNSSEMLNDLDVDLTNGNIYITESFFGKIYRINATTGHATVYKQNAAWAPAPGGFGLNGIVIVDRTLFALVTFSGALISINLDTDVVTTLTLSRPLLMGDGLVVIGNTMHCSSGQMWYTITPPTGGSWASTTGTFNVNMYYTKLPEHWVTTCAIYDTTNDVYALHSGLNPAVNEFWLERFDSSFNKTNLPAIVNATGLGTAPEGITFSEVHQQFIISSTTNNATYRVNDATGALTQLTATTVGATVGIVTDIIRNTLATCVLNMKILNEGGAAQAGFQTGVQVCDLWTGQQLFFVDLSHLSGSTAAHMANDLAIDANGNIYVTDSLGYAVWKIVPDYVAKTATASVLYNVSDTRDAASCMGIGPNGIKAIDNSRLLMTTCSAGHLWLMAMDGSSQKQVTLSQTILGSDGLTVVNANEIVTSSNGKLYAMKTSDDWKTAEVKEWTTPFTQLVTVAGTTTVTSRYDAVYPLHSLLSATQKVFTIEKVSVPSFDNPSDSDSGLGCGLVVSWLTLLLSVLLLF